MDKNKNKNNGAKTGAGEVGNGKESLPERNEKGQFVNSPGPGRGYKKEEKVELDGDLLDMIEQVVVTGLRGAELKDRLKAAGIGIRVQGMKGSDDTDTTPEPFVIQLTTLLSALSEAYLNKTGISLSPIEIIDRMEQQCLNCNQLGTSVEIWEEITDNDRQDTIDDG